MSDDPRGPTEGPTGTGWRPASTPPRARPQPVVTAPPADPPLHVPKAPPPDDLRRSGKTTLVGEARSMQQRTEQVGQQGSRTIWTFRLERYDSSGNRLRPVQVEMRGLAFEGSLSDGDQVRVTGRWRDGTVRADELENLTTGSLVRAKSYKGLMIAALVVFLVVAGLIALFAINAQDDFNRERQQLEQQFNEQFGNVNEQFQQDAERAEQEALQQFCEAAAASGQTPPQCGG